MNTGTTIIKIHKIPTFHYITICDKSLFEMPNCHESTIFITKPWLK